MKPLILTLMSVFILCSCENNHFVPQDIIPILIGKGELYGDGAENIPQQNIVISSQTEFDSLITAMNTINNVSNSFTETIIDFNNFQLIAAFSEIKMAGGSTIDITKIVENSNDISVTVENLHGEGDNFVIEQPFHIVKIPKSTKPIVFQ